VHEYKLRVHLVHEKDDGSIGYAKICNVEDKPVRNNEIVKAFEYGKGEFVQLKARWTSAADGVACARCSSS
jgi:non-homologous end joining protein Ku